MVEAVIVVADGSKVVSDLTGDDMDFDAVIGFDGDTFLFFGTVVSES
jgi:hypothetical protein